MIKPASNPDGTMRIAIGAFLYFLLVMAGGFIFGATREFALIPLLGNEAGQLAEVPFMALAIWLSARFAVAWAGVPAGWQPRLAMGALSLMLVIAAEFALAPAMRGSIEAWLASFSPATGTALLILYAWHVISPWLAASGASRGSRRLR